MNRNDFYKQLMSEYSFNAEEIRKNARKGKKAGRRASPMYIGMAAAAAAITVAAGVGVFSAANRNSGVDLVAGDALAALSDTQRVEKAMQEIARNEGNSAPVDVLITFTSPLSPEKVSEILSSHTSGSAEVEMLCFADGTRAVGSDQVDAAFEGTGMISGAVINCAGSLMGSLNSDPDIYVVEIVTSSDDISVVTPVNVSGEISVIPSDDTSDSSIVDIPPVPDNPGSMDGTEIGTDDPADTSADGNDGEEIDDDTSDDTSDISGDDNTSDIIPDDTISDNISVPDGTTSDNTVSPGTDEPADTSEKLPDGVTLPETADVLNFNTFIDADSAFFLTDDVFYARSADKISLYRFNGSDEAILIDSTECGDAKVCYISETGSRMLVSGVSEDKRKKLFLIDAVGEYIADLSAEELVMDGSLSGIGFNDRTNTLYLNVKDSGTYYVYSLRLENNSLEYIGSCFESTAKIALLASEGDNLYIAATEGSLTQIFRLNSDGSAKDVIATYDNNPKFSSNLAFTHAAVTPSDASVTGSAEIFDPATESFIRLDRIPSGITFGAGRHCFNADGSLYSISGGRITPAAGVSAAAKIEYRKSLSRLYSAYASYGSVKITSSQYSMEAMGGNVTFSEVTDSAPAEIRSALNGAIGVNNILAQGTADRAGITTPGVLIKSVSAFYSDSAEDAILKKCGISEYGSLSYVSGGLTALSVSDTVLVISGSNGTSANGVLYIRVGTFCGSTAYTMKNIEFVMENGSWKLNTVL